MLKIIIVTVMCSLIACAAPAPTASTELEQNEMCFPACGGDGDPIAVATNASVSDVREEYNPNSIDRVACADAAGGILCEVSVTFGSHRATLYCHILYHTEDDGSVVLDGVHCGESP
jgi:hypothetical protein